MNRIGLIVEGHGEVLAMPTLVTRILSEEFQRYDFVPQDKPLRVKRGKFAKKFSDYERALEFLAGTYDRILVVLDSDDDDPSSLVSDLSDRARTCIAHKRVEVVAAVMEFEAWFLASVDALAGANRVLPDSSFSNNPESVRGAKGAFARFLDDGQYSETVDQKKYSNLIDFDLVRLRSPSFVTLLEAIGRLSTEEASKPEGEESDSAENLVKPSDSASAQS